jgi:hypothetical protein
MLYALNYEVLTLKFYIVQSCVIFGLRSTLLFEVKLSLGKVS